MTTIIERMSEKYWNAFRDGYIAVGGNPESYPTWQQSTDPVKNETMRCLRHAVEAVLSLPPDELERLGMENDTSGAPFVTTPDYTMGQVRLLFPDPPQPRQTKRTATEDKFTTSMQIAELDR